MVFGILGEERERLSRLKERYENEIAELPKGSVSRKKRGRKEYCYRAYREGKKVIFEYVGLLDSPETGVLEELINKRKIYEGKLSEVKENLAVVERALRGQK